MASATRKLRLSAAQFKQEIEILHFTPAHLLAPGYALALNISLGTLSLLSPQGDHPRLVMEQQFTVSEIRVLVPLLDAYPYYCPYERILASYETGHLTEEMILHYRMRLFEAQQKTTVWEETMRPVRGVLSRIRLKMRWFGLEISAISETGYLLKKTPRTPAVSAPEPETVQLNIP